MQNWQSIQRMPQEQGNQMFYFHQNKTITHFKSVISRRHNKCSKNNIMAFVKYVRYLLQNLKIVISSVKDQITILIQSNNEELQYYMSKQTYFALSTLFYFLVCLVFSLTLKMHLRNLSVLYAAYKSKDFKTKTVPLRVSYGILYWVWLGWS